MPSTKLAVVDRDRMRRELEKKYPSTYITPSDLPAMSLLHIVFGQAAAKTWEWFPRKKILSDKAATAARPRKSDGPRDAILPWQQAHRQNNGTKNYRRRRSGCRGLLQVRAHAFAMVDACHFGSWALYIVRFLEYYTADVEEHFLPTTVTEAEESDKAALQEVYSLCYAGATLDDALSSVTDCG